MNSSQLSVFGLRFKQGEGGSHTVARDDDLGVNCARSVKMLQLAAACCNRRISVRIDSAAPAFEFTIDGKRMKPRGMHEHIRERAYEQAVTQWSNKDGQGELVTQVLSEQQHLRGARYLHHAFLETVHAVSTRTVKCVLQARVGLLPTKQWLHNRMPRNHLDGNCRFCGQSEHCIHLLSGCPSEQRRKQFVLRHNECVQEICRQLIAVAKAEHVPAECFEAEGPRKRPYGNLPFWVDEPELYAQVGIHSQPDAVFFKEVQEDGDDPAYDVEVFEFAVSSESNMKTRYEEKTDRYQQFCTAVRACSTVRNVHITSVIVGPRCFVFPVSIDELTKMIERLVMVPTGRATYRSRKILTDVNLIVAEWVSKLLPSSRF